MSPQKDSRPGSAGTGIRAAALLLALAVAAQGCGYVGIAGLVYKIASDREEKDEHAPAIASASPIGISQGQLVTIRYSIVDPESDPCDVTPGYSLDGGLTFSAPSELPASLSEGTAELSSSPRGHDHVFVWNAPADVQGYNRTVIFRLTPRERRTSAAGPDWNSAPFVLFANSAPAASVETPAGNPGGRVEIAYTLSDGESNPANVAAAFSIDGGTTWNVPTRFAGLGSEGVSSLTTSQAGIRHVFRWESYPDMGAGDFQVVFRVTPTDSVSGAAGIPAVSPQFTAGNSRARTVAGGAASTMGNPVSCASDSRGVIYFAENPGHRIWAYNPTSSTLLVCGRSLNPRETAAVAGDGSAGFGPDSVPGPESPLDTPLGIAADNATPPAVYFADSQNHRIRRIDASTGFVTTVCGNGAAGTADACPAILGSLDSPEAVACDSTGNLFIADTGNNAIRFINRGFIDKPVAGVTVKPGWIGTVAGQTGAPDGFSGDGGASTAALLDSPAAIVVDQIGNFFFCDSGNSRIRGVAAGSGVLPFGSVAIAAGCIGTVAGGGTYTPGLTERGPRTVQLGAPSGLVLTQSGGMYFPDSSGHAICFVNGSNTVSANTGATTVSPDRLVTVAGTWNVPGSSGDGGSAFQALLQDPSHVCTATGGMLAFVDEGNGRIRVLNTSPPGGPDSTFGSVSLSSAEIGTGLLPDSPGIGAPSGLDSSGASVFFTSASGNRIFRFDSSSGAVAAVAGSGAAGSADGLPGQASFLSPADVAVNYTGVVLLVADSGNSAIRIVNFGGDTSIYGENISAGEVATVTAAAGQLLSPQGLAFSRPTRMGDLFVADTGHHRIVRVSSVVGTVTPVAGDGTPGLVNGPALSARFSSPSGVAVDSSGLILVVADTGNSAIRLVNLSTSTVEIGFVTKITVAPGSTGTIGGTGSAGFAGDGIPAWTAPFNSPSKVALDAFLNVYVSDSGNNRIRKISFSSGLVSTLLGAGPAGFNGDGLPASDTWLDSPGGFAFDQAAGAYFCDTGNGRVRRFMP